MEEKQIGEVEEKEELMPCPGAILRAVAKILIERWKAIKNDQLLSVSPKERERAVESGRFP